MLSYIQGAPHRLMRHRSVQWQEADHRQWGYRWAIRAVIRLQQVDTLLSIPASSTHRGHRRVRFSRPVARPIGVGLLRERRRGRTPIYRGTPIS